MQFTEKDLPDLAGWQVVKRARNLVSAGSVMNSKLDMGDGEPCRVSGVVVEGRRRHVCGLTINSLHDVENHCNCFASSRDGQICEHSIAVALLALNKSSSENTKKTSEQTDVQKITGKMHWFPVPLFDHDLIDKRTIFPMQLGQMGKAYICRDIRNEVLAALSRLGVTFSEDPQRIDFTKSGFLQILAAFKGGSWAGNLQEWPPTRVSSIPVRLPLLFTEIKGRPDIVRLEMPELTGSATLFDGNNYWILREADRLSIPTNYSLLPQSCRDVFTPLLQSLSNPTSVEVETSWLRNELPNLADVFHMECSEQLNELLRIAPVIPEVSLQIEGSLRHLNLCLSFIYKSGEKPNPPFTSQALRILSPVDWEQSRSVNDDQTVCYLGKLKGEELILDFYAGNLDRIMSTCEWDVEIGQRFAEITKNIEKVRPRVTVAGQGNDWLSFDLEFASTGGQCIPEKEIRRLLSTGSSKVRLPEDGYAVFDSAQVGELFEAFLDADADQEVGHPSRRSVRSMDKIFLETHINKFTSSSAPLTSTSTSFEPPPSFHGKLRDYQQSALEWLYARSSRQHGAILADEMGLGKTVQVLALIALMQDAAGMNAKNPCNDGVRPTCIVVCPTSLILNWKQEIRRFLPSKNVLLLHGPSRAIHFNEMHESDIVITSYGALIRDIELYPELLFKLAVADEASRLKNPRTQVAKSMLRIPAQSKIALTGTPMENSIQDLWSIMNFANPGYLGSRDAFISRYVSGVPNQMNRLRKRIAPFMLRRTKEEVAGELPTKVERVLYCELNAEQRRYYEQIINFSRNNFKNIHKSLSDSSERMEIFLMLLRLRQVCCDIRLLSPLTGNKLPTDSSSADQSAPMISAKLIALDDLLKDLMKRGCKVLIFSQFVAMLQLIRGHLDAGSQNYCYLDGSQSPTQRNQQVEAFQCRESQIPIFLMSLKAGGYGLTLTQADSVIHFDPWWNPAVEAQATDRAHRIGQEKTVTSYKLIVGGSVEEKILQLQERKRNMADVALDDAPLMETLSGEDIEFILT